MKKLLTFPIALCIASVGFCNENSLTDSREVESSMAVDQEMESWGSEVATAKKPAPKPSKGKQQAEAEEEEGSLPMSAGGGISPGSAGKQSPSSSPSAKTAPSSPDKAPITPPKKEEASPSSTKKHDAPKAQKN